MLKSVTRIGLHIDYVIMYLCKGEEKDNKMYFFYTCFMGFMSNVSLQVNRLLLDVYQDSSSSYKCN